VTPHDPDDPSGGRHPHDPHHGFPVDPDVTPDDLATGPNTLRLIHDRRDILLVIALGGALGAAARYGLAQVLPHSPGEFPWSTLVANVAGCLAIGVLMVVVVERLSASRLVSPFLGTGVLGGFTTFSTYAVDARALLASGRPAMAASYLLGTLVLGLLAVVVGLRATERLLR